MSTESRIEPPPSEGISEAAARNTIALNPLVGIRGQDLVDSAGILFKAMINEPKVATEQWLSFVGELGEIVGGKSERAPKSGDRRFSDPTWKESSLHSGLLKAYLAWGDAVNGLVDKTNLSNIDKARAHLITEILIDAVAPTNAILTNPAAVRKFMDTGGQSLWQGLKNYFDDLTKNRGMPSMVDTTAFKVGENLATTPGAIVFRNELLELIQYAPTTPKVWKRPLVVTPPQINKYYALDLSPDKSMVRFLLESGIQPFCVSWRNPTEVNRDWGLDTYVTALDEAVDAARNHRQRRHLNDGFLFRGHHLDSLFCHAWQRCGKKDQEHGAGGLPARSNHRGGNHVRLPGYARNHAGRQGGFPDTRDC